ncbi:glycosyltransferase family 4 protein [Bradyrhizobium ottawaense]|nr:glycosyltransferase family 4 protein [Bradyrhizobium ottawaense]
MPAINSPGERLFILAVGQIPPPVTGFAFITARMIATLADSAEVETINMSPGGRRGLLKHLHKGRQTIWACWRIARNTHHPRLAYVGCEGDWGLVYTAALALAARLFGHTILLHHHSFSYIDRASRLMRIILAVSRTRIRHIFLCTTMRDRFQRRYGNAREYSIVSNAAFVEARLDSDRADSSSERLRIGLLSNLTREKGLHTFINLVRGLSQSGLNVQALLAGPIAGEDDKAHVAAAEAELGGALRYIGPVYGEAKDRFYNEIDVFIFPTNYVNEAQPTVLFEALAAGNRVIAYDRGCISTQIVRGGGLAIDPTADFCGVTIEYLRKARLETSFARNAIIQEFQLEKESALTIARNLLPLSRTEF